MNNLTLSLTQYTDPILGLNIVEIFLGAVVIGLAIHFGLKLWNGLIK